MIKSAIVFMLAALVAGGILYAMVFFIWRVKALVSADRNKIREETLEARQAIEDLELAVLREERKANINAERK